MKGLLAMSNDIYFFMEVKDRKGDWQLVKYIENGKFNEDETITEKYGDSYYHLQYPFELKKTLYVGKGIRDALRSKFYYKNNKLPDDMTTELKGVMESKAISDNRHDIDYSTHYICVNFSFLTEEYERRLNNLLSFIRKKFEFAKTNYIINKIENAKNEILNAILPKESSDVDDEIVANEHENCKEIDYSIEDEIENIMEIREEIKALKTYASSYTGDKFINDENIRVYCFFE